MKALVAGGADFIDSHICRRLFKDGHRVVSIDTCQTAVWRDEEV